MGILTQKVRKYIEKEYPEKLKIFRENLSGSELDFIESEIRYFEKEYMDLANLADEMFLEYKSYESKKIRESILFIERVIEYLNSRRQELVHKLQPIKEFKLKPRITKKEIENLFDWLKSNKYSDSPGQDFFAVFSNEYYNQSMPDKWKPVRWLRICISGPNKGKPHTTSLAAIIRESLTIKASDPWKEKMSKFFVDKNNNPIRPPIRSSKKNLNEYLP